LSCFRTGCFQGCGHSGAVGCYRRRGNGWQVRVVVGAGAS